MEAPAPTTLRAVELPDPDGSPLPPRVARYLESVEERLPGLTTGHELRAGAGFIPSDFPAVYAMLATLVAADLAPGGRFLEWGSGLGVVAGLASELGFEAHGIEIRRELVDAAELLAADFEMPVEFAHGTFIPASESELADAVAEYPWWTDTTGSAYEELGLEIDDFDVIYAYPWPGEEELLDTLFLRHGAVGALLLTYHGEAGTRLQRKVTRA